MHQELEIAISPCPNDTYAFEALLSDRSHSLFSLKPSFFDIDTLNQLALEKRYPIIKASAAIYPLVQNDYTYARSGAAFASSSGGPMVITNKHNINLARDIQKLTVITPGLTTSAYTAFCHLYGVPKRTIQMPYHQIAEALAYHSEYDIGILIHEARTTYDKQFAKLLFPIVDLNHAYQTQNQYPMPLGLILIRNDVPHDVASSFEKALQTSIETAMKREKAITPFILRHASDLSQEAILQHIALYVNQDTLAISSSAEKALHFFFRKLHHA